MIKNESDVSKPKAALTSQLGPITFLQKKEENDKEVSTHQNISANILANPPEEMYQAQNQIFFKGMEKTPFCESKARCKGALQCWLLCPFPRLTWQLPTSLSKRATHCSIYKM